MRPHTDNTVDCSLTQASAAEAQPLLYLFISFKLKPHLLSYLPPSNVKATADSPQTSTPSQNFSPDGKEQITMKKGEDVAKYEKALKS